MKKRSLALAIALLTTAAATSAVAGPPGLTVLASGSCVATTPVAGPWDVYEDMFQADAPTWLPAHTHNGIECTLGTRGTTMWWFSGSGKHPVPAGSALFTVQGRVHTAGNDGPAPMTYFAVHVLVAGSPYRTLVDDPTAPKQVSTNGTSPFHNIFPNQPAIAGTFTTRLRVLSLAPGASFDGERTSGMAYYTVISGQVTVTTGGATATYGQYAKWASKPGLVATVKNPGRVPAVLGTARVY